MASTITPLSDCGEGEHRKNAKAAKTVGIARHGAAAGVFGAATVGSAGAARTTASTRGSATRSAGGRSSVDPAAEASESTHAHLPTRSTRAGIWVCHALAFCTNLT